MKKVPKSEVALIRVFRNAVMKRAHVKLHVSLCPCLVLLSQAELMARCCCESVRMYISCVQRAFFCGDAPISAGDSREVESFPACVASAVGILFWQAMVPVHRCFRQQIKKLQGRRKGAKFKSAPQTKFQNRRYSTNFGAVGRDPRGES